MNRILVICTKITKSETFKDDIRIREEDGCLSDLSLVENLGIKTI